MTVAATVTERTSERGRVRDKGSGSGRGRGRDKGRSRGRGNWPSLTLAPFGGVSSTSPRVVFIVTDTPSDSRVY